MVKGTVKESLQLSSSQSISEESVCQSKSNRKTLSRPTSSDCHISIQTSSTHKPHLSKTRIMDTGFGKERSESTASTHFGVTYKRWNSLGILKNSEEIYANHRVLNQKDHEDESFPYLWKKKLDSHIFRSSDTSDYVKAVFIKAVKVLDVKSNLLK